MKDIPTKEMDMESLADRSKPSALEMFMHKHKSISKLGRTGPGIGIAKLGKAKKSQSDMYLKDKDGNT